MPNTMYLIEKCIWLCDTMGINCHKFQLNIAYYILIFFINSFKLNENEL